MRRLIAFTSLVLLAGCVQPSAPPPPAPPPPPRPVPTPAPTAAPLPADWRDWPVTPGDWSWQQMGQGSSIASFGRAGAAPELTLRCDKQAGRIHINRGGSATQSATLTIRTTSTTRVLPAQPVGGPAPGLTATLPARDPLLDAMGFSRGRFLVEMPGTRALVVPAWAEVLRVVEDCRRP